MRTEELLSRLRSSTSPSSESKERVRTQMMSRMRAPALLQEIKAELTPAKALRSTLWSRVQQSIAPEASTTLLGQLKEFLAPASGVRLMLRERIVSQLVPQHRTPLGYLSLKWASAFVLFAVVVRISPLLFLAPHTAAESSVLAMATTNTASILMDGFWQPLEGEIKLLDGARFRTDGQGNLTVIFRDNGTARLGSSTVVAVHDIADHSEPAFHGATMTLEQGKLWVQGLLPEQVRPIIVSTPYGDISLYSASISIEVGDTVDVRVWDGHVTVLHNNESSTLVAGDRIELWQENIPSVRRVNPQEANEPWVKQNLERDASHRREVAQWQQERKAAQAGILPTSPLYPVKRAAETMDMLLTFDEHERVQKKIDQASTRLNEAAALISQGNSGASVPLAEYQATLQEVAAGSSTTIVQFMLRQKIAENTAQLAAASPDDEGYALKKAVLEAGASLPEQVIDERDVQGTLLVDTLSVVHDAVNAGNIDHARLAFADAQPLLESLRGTGSLLKPDVRKEALALLSTVASALGEGELDIGTGSVQKALLHEIVEYVPVVKHAERPPMTPEQIRSLVQGMYDRIFLYKQPRARWNQLQYEMTSIRGNPDEGTILRHLYHALPENGLARYVRTEIQRLRLEMETK